MPAALRENKGKDAEVMVRTRGNREELLKRRRRRRQVRIFILIVCCLTAFFLGKMVGRAQKSQEARNAVRAADEEILRGQGMAFSPDAGGDDGGSRFFAAGTAEKNTAGEKTAGGDSSEAALILVNRDNPLPADYEPELVTLEDGVHQSAKAAYSHLCDMLRAGIREGLSFEVCSAYRSAERQRQLFEEDVRALTAAGWSYERAYEEVARETMPPGCSEHSTGLAFDIVALDYQMLDEKQAYTAENIWLREHCAEYGFILRYPKEKEDITRISYESWHFRYVGVDAAQEITEREITLEEYLQEQQTLL